MWFNCYVSETMYASSGYIHVHVHVCSPVHVHVEVCLHGSTYTGLHVSQSCLIGYYIFTFATL